MDAECNCSGIAHYGICQVCGGSVEVSFGGDYGQAEPSNVAVPSIGAEGAPGPAAGAEAGSEDRPGRNAHADSLIDQDLG